MKNHRLRWALPALLLLGYGEALHAQAVPSQAFTNVTLHYADGTSVPRATILWRNGSIEAAGTNVTIPFDARVIDGGDSLHVYPGWIAGISEWGVPAPAGGGGQGGPGGGGGGGGQGQGQVQDPGNPTYERAGILPGRSASSVVVENSRDFADWRKLGFTSAGVSPRGNMLPGTVDLYTFTGALTEDGGRLLIPDLGRRAAIRGAGGVYPGTTMAVMARLRQLMYDAEALKTNQRLFTSNATAYKAPEQDLTLEALWPVMEGRLPFYFAADDPAEIQRVLKLKNELGFNMILVSGLKAGLIADDLAKAGIPVLVSLNYPAKPASMASPGAPGRSQRDTTAAATPPSPEQLEHQKKQEEAWKADVANALSLMKAGVKVGFSGLGLRSADFQTKFRELTEAGMTVDQLVQMLSSGTASIMGRSNLLGDIKPNMLAGFNLYNAPLSESRAQLVYSVADGDLKFFPVKANPAQARGNR